MTSKNALKHIKNNDFNMIIATYPPIPSYNGFTKDDMFEIIEKDLEALEILKELFSNNDYLTILLKTNYLYKIKDETKLNLIKEWLKND